MFVSHILVYPISPQLWQLTSNIIGYLVISSSVSGLVKSILWETNALSQFLIYSFVIYCFQTYYSPLRFSLVFYTLQPISKICSTVLLKSQMVVWGSVLGAKGFLMKDKPLGSSILMVKGRPLAVLRSPILTKNYSIFSYRCWSIAFLTGCYLLISSMHLLINPSTVVISPFLLDGIQKSIYGMIIVACSDLMISRLRSFSFATLNLILIPWSANCPPN